jgi:hypothetical protein
MLSALVLTALAQGAVPRVARVEATPDSVTIEVDQSATLRVQAWDSGGATIDPSRLQFFSPDGDIATVDSTGLISAHRPGQVTLLVGRRGVFARVSVTVPQLPPATIELSLPGSIEVPVGTSAPFQVTAVTRLGDVIPAVIDWRTDDPALATVDAAGRLWAHGPGDVVVTALADEAMAEHKVTLVPNRATAYRIVPPEPGHVRTGDVVRLHVEGVIPDGVVTGYRPSWSAGGPGATIEADGEEGVFVAEQPGRYRITAVLGERALATTLVEVTPRHLTGRIELVGRGPVADHHTGDTWVFEGVDGRDYAYVGTYHYDWMKVWDVTDPSNPVLTDSVQMDARRINDVKIHDNNRLAIVTREGASNRRNGFLILDLSQPAHPALLSEYTETVTGGVHNVWILSERDLVYAVHNGTAEVHIVDISDPAAPREIGRWGLDKENKGLHDVIVQDGYAYLSYWNDGLVTLDAGAGTHGGTPESPTFVSQFEYPVPNNTHTAWRHGRYLFVGDEVYPADWNGDADRRIDARGYIHVLDMMDMERPVEVARYEVPEAGAHNVWVEDDILYVGYYQAGLRAVDVSGELRGDLYAQGREIDFLLTTDENTTVPNWPMAWGAQVYKGHLFTSDLHSGLWVTKLIRPEPPIP